MQNWPAQLGGAVSGANADPFGFSDQIPAHLGADEPIRQSGSSGVYEADPPEYLRGDTFNGRSELLVGGPSTAAEADVIAYLKQISRKNNRRPLGQASPVLEGRARTKASQESWARLRAAAGAHVQKAVLPKMLSETQQFTPGTFNAQGRPPNGIGSRSRSSTNWQKGGSALRSSAG